MHSTLKDVFVFLKVLQIDPKFRSDFQSHGSKSGPSLGHCGLNLILKIFLLKSSVSRFSLFSPGAA